MMFERFTVDARAIVVQAQQHARRLGHHYIGGEHILLALVSADDPASAVLGTHSITPGYVEEEIIRRVGLGPDAGPVSAAGTGPAPAAGPFGNVDRDALASIGIDLDAVCARIEASFGPRALIQADQAVRYRERGPRRPWADPRRALPRRLRRSWRRGGDRRQGQRPVIPAPAREPGQAHAARRYRAGRPASTGHIPFTPVAKKILELSLREMVGLHDSSIGVAHIALALTAVRQGMVPDILHGADASAAVLHAEIIDRYRQAS
jgi:hypothetical protein